MTVLEFVHFKNPAEMNATVEQMKQYSAKLTTFAAKPAVSLDRSQLSLDETAVAITFLPAEERKYTCLHIRRDLTIICAENEVKIASRYFNTSSHITSVWFANKSDLKDQEILES